MRTVQIKLFTFEELNTQAQSKALTTFRDVNVSMGVWADIIIENWCDMMENDFGITIDAKKLYYAIHFEPKAIWDSEAIDVDKFTRALDNWCKDKTEYGKWVRLVENNTHSSCDMDFYPNNRAGRMEVSFVNPAKFNSPLYDLLEDFNTVMQNFATAMSKELTQNLVSEYELATSDDTVSEYIINMDIEFTEDGNVWESYELEVSEM